jgi:branched-chain amino acid transport system substrate-binding protein
MRRIRFPGKAGFAVILLAAVALLPLAVACGGEEKEGTATPKATATAAATGTAKPTAAASPGAVGPGVTDTEIILGRYTPLTGTAGAVYGILDRAMRAYFEYVNEEKGGVCGRKIVLKTYDDGGTEEGALEAVRKLVEEDKVFAIVTSGLTPSYAAMDYLNEKGVPDLSSSAVADTFSLNPEKYRWLTIGTPSATTVGHNIAQYITEELPGKKVAVLWPNDETGRNGLAGLKAGLDPNINEVIADESIELTAIDIRAQVLRLKNSGAEVLALFTAIPQTAQALKQASRLDWRPALPAHYGNADSILFNYVTPEEVEGLITFHAFKMPDWTDDPAVAEHHRVMAQYGGPTPGIFTIYIQVAGEIIVESLNRSCDNLTREAVMKANRSFSHWRSELLYPGCYVNTSDTDLRYLQGGPAMIVVLEDGKPVWKVYREKPYDFFLPGEE